MGNMEENRVCFIDIPDPKSRSISPLTPSPRMERNIGFFHALSRRFGRQSHDELNYNGEEDSRSSSTDSCSSTAGGHIQSNRKDVHNSNLELSCSSSDTSSNAGDVEKTSVSTSRLHRRSTSSIRRALQNFSISTRSLSCSSTPLKESSQKSLKKQPQKILRQPVSYTYLKGMSGLPTQRVPRTSVCCQYSRR
ncbi:uncharacterized protein LOC119649112 [Hermetia illucens]|nr:uncharacterized protein LOC119649112 [Hermetia illucens]